MPGKNLFSRLTFILSAAIAAAGLASILPRPHSPSDLMDERVLQALARNPQLAGSSP